MGGATNQYNRQRSGASNGGQKSNGTVWTVNHVLEHIKLMFFSLDRPCLATENQILNTNCQMSIVSQNFCLFVSTGKEFSQLGLYSFQIEMTTKKLLLTFSV